MRIGRREAAAAVGLAGVAVLSPLGVGVGAGASVARAAPDARDAIGGGALPGTAEAATPGAGGERAIEPPDSLAAHALAAPGTAERALLGALADGAPFDAGRERYRVASVFACRAGAIPLVVERVSGEPMRFAIELLRRDPGDAVQPVAETGSLALFVQNRGDGSRATQEAQGLAVRALARTLAAREADGVRAPALLTRAERAARHPMGVFHVPL